MSLMIRHRRLILFFITALLWMKEVVGHRCLVDRYKLFSFKHTTSTSVTWCSVVSPIPRAMFSPRGGFEVCPSALAAFFLLLVRRRPEVRSIWFGSKVARDPTGPQSEWRTQEEQVPEKRLPEGTGVHSSVAWAYVHTPGTLPVYFSCTSISGRKFLHKIYRSFPVSTSVRVLGKTPVGTMTVR